ncbi:hypothetical protein PAT3040_01656 [Paenibacillus agaridevorans]|uniref:Uncharacterized protein n=1 Tax=Paenibacillus agaridevorans TaxID=171404 RepID=A0A2R5EQ37_9BACL|nr:hypothetical protein PAT3040_01656 [Paenibacillus agaridevorans]
MPTCRIYEMEAAPPELSYAISFSFSRNFIPTSLLLIPHKLDETIHVICNDAYRSEIHKISFFLVIVD